MSYNNYNPTTISVTNFGAKGNNNGSASERECIQNAIDSLYPKGGGTLFFPNGIYSFPGILKVTGNNISLVGDKNAWLHAVDENDFRKIAISGTDTGVLLDGNSVVGLKISGGRVTGLTESYDSVIYIKNTKNTTIKDCRITSSLGVSILTEYNNENINVLNNRIEQYHVGIFNHGKQSGCGLKYLTVDNNVFDKSWSETSEEWFTAIKIQGPHGYPCYGHKITNNKIYSPSMLGIELWGNVYDSVVANNYTESGVFGISIAAESRDITVANNVVKNSTYLGIEAAESSRITIVGNVVDGGEDRKTRDGIIINSVQGGVVSSNLVYNCNHGHISTFVSNANLHTRNINIIGNSIQNSGNGGGAGIYYQGGHNVNITDNSIDIITGASYFVMIDTAGNPIVQSGLTIARNDFIGSVDQWGVLFYGPGGSGIKNVLLEENRTYSVKDCFYGMLDYGGYPPISALSRNNYGPTGDIGYKINDFQEPEGSTPYTTNDIENGFTYYSSNSWTVPSGGVTGDGVWLCVWSGGFGAQNNVRIDARNTFNSYDNQYNRIEVFATMTPYVGFFTKDTLYASPFYKVNVPPYIQRVKTISNDVNAQNSLWFKIAPLPTGVAGNDFYFKYSKPNNLSEVYSTYIEPVDTSNNSTLYLDNSYNYDAEATYKYAEGLTIGPHCAVSVTAPNSGALYLRATGVGIGVSSPTAQLHTTSTVRFANFGAGTATFDANGNISSSSDERLKSIIGDYKGGLNEITGLQPIIFNWKPESELDTQNKYVGFSAQQVKEYIPEAVFENSGKYYSLDDRPIIAALVGAVKELTKKVERLENKNEN